MAMKTVQFEWTIGMYRKWRMWSNFVHCHVSLRRVLLCLFTLFDALSNSSMSCFCQTMQATKKTTFCPGGPGIIFFWGGCANKWRDFEGFALMSWFYFMTPKNLGYTHQSFTFRGPKMPPFQGNRFAYIVRRPKPGLIDQNLGDDIGWLGFHDIGWCGWYGRNVKHTWMVHDGTWYELIWMISRVFLGFYRKIQ